MPAQTTIDLAKFILSAGDIDFARFNAIFGLDGGSRFFLRDHRSTPFYLKS
jgi:hypothetical protein